MSQPGPSTTPSRRRPLPLDTPGSARSNSSTTSSTDRTTLLDRIEDLDLEIHDLKRQIVSERKRLRSFSSSTSSISNPSQQTLQNLSYLDPDFKRNAVEIQTVIQEKLKQMDDDALTALLSASNVSITRFIGKGEVDLGLIPSKSVGVEGIGSGSDIDRRISLSQGKVGKEMSKVLHDQSINQWLKDRERRTHSLVDALSKFTFLQIDHLSQVENREGRGRKINLIGKFGNLFQIEIKFEVIEEIGGDSSPQIRDLEVKLPSWLKETLDNTTPFNKMLKRNDLPSILLMLRTMIPLISLRRNLYTSLMEKYTDLVRSFVRNWESEFGIDFIPFYPNSKKRSTKEGVDEKLAKSLIYPSQAEYFTLTNSKGASLTFKFSIQFNRFGHALPQFTAKPNIPNKLLNSTNKAFLDGFEKEFNNMLKVGLNQDGIIGLPDMDEDEELDPLIGRWGIMPVVNAVIKAFFGLEEEEEESGEEESV